MMHSISPPDRPPRPLLLALFVLGFLITSALLRTLGGHPDLGLLDDKLRYFTAHKDRYDLVFFGSSRVYRGIIPPLFDKEVAAHGRAVRSFNFGIAGMQPHEANALMRRVLALEPARLRWVVVELDDWDPDVHPENRFKRRGVFWHDLPETLSALHSTLLIDASLVKRLDLLSMHVLHLAVRSFGVGRGPDMARSAITRRARAQEPAPSDDQPLFTHQGFGPFTERSYRSHPARRRFLDSLDAYANDVAGLASGNASNASLRRYNRRALAEQIAMVRQTGAEPIHLVPPIPDATPQLFALQRQGYVPWLLSFNDPVADQDLLATANRFDREHLTQEGAEAFTRRLASRFATVVAQHDRQGMPHADSRANRLSELTGTSRP